MMIAIGCVNEFSYEDWNDWFQNGCVLRLHVFKSHHNQRNQETIHVDTTQNTKGVKILPIMDTQVQPIAPLWIEDPSVELS
jgi:hypothetical protein